VQVMRGTAGGGSRMDRRAPARTRLRAGIGWWLAGLTLVVIGPGATGCGWLGGRDRVASEPPPAEEPAGPMPDDFTGPLPYTPADGETDGSRAARRTPRPPARSRPVPEAPPPAAPDPAEERAAAEADTIPAVGAGAEPRISVQLSAQERIRLAEETTRDLMRADDCLSRLDQSRLDGKQMEVLQTLQGIIASAADARARDDVLAAARLALKAKLLAEELVAK